MLKINERPIVNFFLEFVLQLEVMEKLLLSLNFKLPKEPNCGSLKACVQITRYFYSCYNFYYFYARKYWYVLEQIPVREEQERVNYGRVWNRKSSTLLIQELGKGAYGTVFLAKLKDTGNIRAIKQIKRSSVRVPATFTNEIEILKRLDHPNIIKIYETFEDKDNYYVITE